MNYNVLYVCGTDEYGTATETKALEEGISPQVGVIVRRCYDDALLLYVRRRYAGNITTFTLRYTIGLT